MVIVDVIGKLNGFADNISDLYEVSLKLRAGGGIEPPISRLWIQAKREWDFAKGKRPEGRDALRMQRRVNIVSYR